MERLERINEKLKRFGLTIVEKPTGMIVTYNIVKDGHVIKTSLDYIDVEEFLDFYDRVITMEELNSLGGI